MYLVCRLLLATHTPVTSTLSLHDALPICQFQGMQKLVVAPFELHDRLLQLIEREADNARAGLPARVIIKVNSLAEPRIIEALYRASQAGVDRKSTRLNSSHRCISYAVFCLRPTPP